MKFLSKSAEETRKIGADFSEKLLPLKNHSLIGITGDLGSGKTTFIQGMARGLGIDPRYYVSSPTFTLVNEYVRKESSGPRLIHVDLYRIEKPQEGHFLALEEYFQPGHIVVIEWPERLPELLSLLQWKIEMKNISLKEREIGIEEAKITSLRG